MIFDDDKYTDQQKRCIPDVSFELIPIKNLVSNQEYQRPLSEGHIRRALEEFDVYQINPVKVSRRDGINFVFDGQHTIEIVATESGSRETPVWCMVYDDLKYTEEAHIFADQQKHVKNLVPYETFKAHIEAGDEKQMMIQTTVNSYGLSITSSNQPNGIAAVSTLERIYDKFGQNVLDTTLRLAVQTWEGETNSLSGNVLMGIARIVVAYGELIKEDVFKDHVGKVSVKQIIRTAKERRPGAMGYAEAMMLQYIEDTYPQFIMAADGARYHINERDFFVIGGAYSVDKYYRLRMGYRWFEDEQLTQEEMDAIRRSIDVHGHKEDILLAHTCPYEHRPVEAFLPGLDESTVDNSMEHFLQEIVDTTEYNAFYCGHWHIEKRDGKIRFLFHDMVMLEDKNRV